MGVAWPGRGRGNQCVTPVCWGGGAPCPARLRAAAPGLWHRAVREGGVSGSGSGKRVPGGLSSRGGRWRSRLFALRLEHLPGGLYCPDARGGGRPFSDLPSPSLPGATASPAAHRRASGPPPGKDHTASQASRGQGVFELAREYGARSAYGSWWRRSPAAAVARQLRRMPGLGLQLGSSAGRSRVLRIALPGRPPAVVV